MDGTGIKRKYQSEQQTYDNAVQPPSKRANYCPHKFLLKINKLQLTISTQTEQQKYSIHRLLQDIKGHSDNRSINAKYEALFKIKWHLFNFTSNPSKDREKVAILNEKFVSVMFQFVNFIQANHSSNLPQDFASSSSNASGVTDLEIMDYDSGPESLNENSGSLSSKSSLELSNSSNAAQQSSLESSNVPSPLFSDPTELDLANLKFKVRKNQDRTVFQEKWMAHFQQLQEFNRAYGHSNVSKTTPGYQKLGAWLAEQRRKLKRGKLTEQQYHLMNELGVQWKTIND